MQVLGIQTGSIRQLAERLRGSAVRLRWGGPQVANAINGQCHLLDGLAQLRALRDVGIACPDFTTDLREAQAWQRAGAVVLARKANHTQGKDILVLGERVRGRRLPEDSDFWVRYTPALSEWRFHILNGSSIARATKVWAGQGQAPTDPGSSPVVRSRRLGWHMAHDIDPPKGLREAAKRAVAAVGYDLGAVDLLLTRQGPMVLEVNSRPAIRDNYTLDRYAIALGAL